MIIQYDQYLCRFTTVVKDGDDEYQPGYYFVDEASQLQGPYETLDEARTQLHLWAAVI